MSIWPSTEFTIETPLTPAEIEHRMRPHVRDSDESWFDIAPGDIPEFEGAFWDGGFQVRLMFLNARSGPAAGGSTWIANYATTAGCTVVSLSSIRDWNVWAVPVAVVILESGAVLGRFGTGVPQIAVALGIALIVLVIAARQTTAHRDAVRARLVRWILPDA